MFKSTAQTRSRHKQLAFHAVLMIAPFKGINYISILLIKVCDKISDCFELQTSLCINCNGLKFFIHLYILHIRLFYVARLNLYLQK